MSVMILHNHLIYHLFLALIKNDLRRQRAHEEVSEPDLFKFIHLFKLSFFCHVVKLNGGFTLSYLAYFNLATHQCWNVNSFNK